MKSLLVTLLTWMCIAQSAAIGHSITIPVNPDGLNQSAFTFEFFAKPTSEGANFHFKAILTRDTLSTFDASLATIQTIRTATQITESGEKIRSVPIDIKNKVYSATFYADNKLINTKNLYFVFTEQVRVMMNGEITLMPSATLYIFSLKDFYTKAAEQGAAANP